MFFGGKGKKERQQTRTVAKAAVEIETIVGPNTCLQGDVRSSGGMRVDGDYGGTIDIAGNLVIGESAKVVATISARNVQIQGTVKGDITAARIEILDTGKLWGDITVESWVLDDGGFFQGQCHMQTDADPPLLQAPQAASNDIVDARATPAD